MSICTGCLVEINYEEDGGHIYPDGCVVCADCEGKRYDDLHQSQ